MADYPRYTWYIEDSNLIILEEDPNEDRAYVTPVSDNTNGILLRYVAQYSLPSSMSSQVVSDHDLFIAIVEFVKARMFEDSGDLRRATYYRNKFYEKAAKYKKKNRVGPPIVSPSGPLVLK